MPVLQLIKKKATSVLPRRPVTEAREKSDRPVQTTRHYFPIFHTVAMQWSQDYRRDQSVPARQRKIWSRPLCTPAFTAAAAIATVLLVFVELTFSPFEEWYFTRLAKKCTFTVEQGPSTSIRFPANGPYDLRLGYSRIPGFIAALSSAGFAVVRQARISPEMGAAFDHGYNLPFNEKQQAGMTMRDKNGRIIFQSLFPSPVYASFDSIPDITVKSLLAIEDKKLLDRRHPSLNPAVNWQRFFLAAFRYAESRLGIRSRVPGASTLATQMEKYRHSSRGKTSGASEKFRQMKSASLLAYRGGGNTVPARREITLQYINTSPLGAVPGYGEIFGLGEGLRSLYGVNFDSVNAALRGDGTASLETRARYFRMVLSLLFAHQRPGFYLGSHPDALARKTDAYLRLLANRGVVPEALCDAALSCRVSIGRPAQALDPPAFPLLKPVNSVLDPLAEMLPVRTVYDLARLDCGVDCTLDSAATAYATGFFRNLETRLPFLDSLGLRAPKMLDKGDPSAAIYSLILFERKNGVNMVRVQADSYGAPLNFTSGIRLDLGSTAKLRTLITYLEIVEDLHRRFSAFGKKELAALAPRDRLSAWGKSYLLAAADTSLGAMLDAALDRTYSASPHEVFFTAGGVHQFENFDRGDDGRIVSVREAFKFSINLAFVRVMRDIVDYYIAMAPGTADLSSTAGAQEWMYYLNRFIVLESDVFLAEFHRQLKAVPPGKMADTLVAEIRSSPRRLAAIYCAVEKNPAPEGLMKFMQRHGITDTSLDNVTRLVNKTQGFSLSDRGFVAGIHPLKLLTAGYLAQNPGASLAALRLASIPSFQDAYKWIYSRNRISFQRSRIRIMLETDAFVAILHNWQRQGYPFAELTPSYATAIGASADRPSSLAQLAGIIQNGGVKLKTVRIERLTFGAGTPYETVLSDTGGDASRVLSEAVAAKVRSCMLGVVTQGTAVRACKTFDASTAVGGKTGTGDHRQRFFGPGGVLKGEVFVDRAATFVFLIGDRFFGAITVAVLGPRSKDYDFTSSYPVQLFVDLAPKLISLMDGNKNGMDRTPDKSHSVDIVQRKMSETRPAWLAAAPDAAGLSLLSISGGLPSPFLFSSAESKR